MSKILELSAENGKELSEVGKALASRTRIEILKLLYYHSFNVGEIAEKLAIPSSSAALHIRLLEEAGLINTELHPGSHGTMKLCSRRSDYVNIRLLGEPGDIDRTSTAAMPLGAFTDCRIVPPCGIAGPHALIGADDRPADFFLPERINAQLLWSTGGYIEYRFPYPLKGSQRAKELILSFEACSEAPNYQEDWKSDISVWINGVECAVWQCPGDFGSRRGRLTPAWWGSGVTQYGMLTTVTVSAAGTRLNSQAVSGPRIEDLRLAADCFITLRIGNRDDAVYRGGFNLFGRCFGDYEQDIILSLVYSD